MSNRQLALMIGVVSYAWVNRRISTGETDLTFEDTQLIADALGVPVQRFLAGWLDYGVSSNTALTGALPAGSNTLSDDNVIDLKVRSSDGEGPGVMRTTWTAAA